jgi:hypothetical protein
MGQPTPLNARQNGFSSGRFPGLDIVVVSDIPIGYAP